MTYVYPAFFSSLRLRHSYTRAGRWTARRRTPLPTLVVGVLCSKTLDTRFSGFAHQQQHFHSSVTFSPTRLSSVDVAVITRTCGFISRVTLIHLPLLTGRFLPAPATVYYWMHCCSFIPRTRFLLLGLPRVPHAFYYARAARAAHAPRAPHTPHYTAFRVFRALPAACTAVGYAPPTRTTHRALRHCLHLRSALDGVPGDTGVGLRLPRTGSFLHSRYLPNTRGLFTS